MRQPNRIVIKSHGVAHNFYVGQYPLKEQEKLHAWLGRVIEFRKQEYANRIKDDER